MAQNIIGMVIFTFVLAFIIIVVYLGIGSDIFSGREVSEDELAVGTLCYSWLEGNCTMDALTRINGKQMDLGQETLSNLCIKVYPMETDQKSIIRCQDICRNKCNANLHYDVGVYPYDIRFYESRITVRILNVGSGSVYDVRFNVTNADNGNVIYIGYVDYIEPHSSELTSIFTSATDIEVEVYYNDTNADNNFAENALA